MSELRAHSHHPVAHHPAHHSLHHCGHALGDEARDFPSMGTDGLREVGIAASCRRPHRRRSRPPPVTATCCGGATYRLRSAATPRRACVSSWRSTRRSASRSHTDPARHATPGLCRARPPLPRRLHARHATRSTRVNASKGTPSLRSASQKTFFAICRYGGRPWLPHRCLPRIGAGAMRNPGRRTTPAVFVSFFLLLGQRLADMSACGFPVPWRAS